MRVVIVPVLQDNYAYLLVDEESGQAAAIDPAEPQKLINAAKKTGVTITCVLTTHYHKDHAGGNAELKKLLPDIKVYGGVIDNVEACTHPLENGNVVVLGEKTFVKAIHTPCHTKGHMCYYVTTENGRLDPLLFTGDTLFVGGCGRFFEGDAADMYHSLCKVIGLLPPATKLYCGHEYTVQNLKFAAWMEPRNAAVREKLQWAQERRKKNLPTIPSTIAQELKHNPFMRVDLPVMQDALQKDDPVEIMDEVRTRKNNFA